MLSIPDIVASNPQPNDWNRKQPSRSEIDKRIEKTRKKESARYEDAVLNFLFENRDELGIHKVFRLKNQLMDGEIELPSGELVPFEIKLRMNWMKACQAGFQLRRYLVLNELKRPSIQAAIVFFDAFSTGWDKKRKKRPIELGWIAWYVNHCRIEGKPFHLVQWSPGKPLQCCPAESVTTAAPSGLL